MRTIMFQRVKLSSCPLDVTVYDMGPLLLLLILGLEFLELEFRVSILI